MKARLKQKLSGWIRSGEGHVKTHFPKGFEYEVTEYKDGQSFAIRLERNGQIIHAHLTEDFATILDKDLNQKSININKSLKKHKRGKR